MSGRASWRAGARAVPRAVALASALLAGASVARAAAAPPPPAAAAVPFPSPEVRAWQTGLLRPDRIQHASLAMTLGLSVGVPSRSPAASFATGFMLGLAKEFWDARHDRFDVWDLVADTGGAAASAAITQALRE